MEDSEKCQTCNCFIKLTIDETIIKCSAAIEPKYNNRKCPCLDCLLKMICTEGCNDFYNYEDFFTEDH